MKRARVHCWWDCKPAGRWFLNKQNHTTRQRIHPRELKEGLTEASTHHAHSGNTHTW